MLTIAFLTVLSVACHANSMNPQYDTRPKPSKKLIIIIIALLVLCTCTAIVVLIEKKNNANKPLFTPPKTTSSSQAQYSGTNAGLKFSYPATWKDVSEPGSDVTTVTYTVSGQTYRLRISPPSQINPEGVDGLTHQTTVITYNDRPYSRTVWYTNGKAFYITAIPAQTQDTANTYVLSMQLPPTDTQQYIATFDQIAGTLSY